MKRIISLLMLLIMSVTLTTSVSCFPPTISSSLSPTQTSHVLKDVTGSMPKIFQNLIASGTGSFNADIQLNADLPIVPDQLTVYQIPKIDNQYALNTAKLFGLENNPVPLIGGERKVFSYSNDQEILEVNFDGSFHLYQRKSTTSVSGSLPSEDDCLKIAREWLQLKGLYPENVIRIETGVTESIGTAEKGSAPTEFIPLKIGVAFISSRNGYESYLPQARVIIGDKGKVLELTYNNPVLIEYGIIRLKTPDAALNMLITYLTDTSFNPPYADECNANYRGFTRLVINRISLEYTIPSKSYYFQPVYVFEGDVYQINNPNPDKFVGRVDATGR
jgi:hypothetical protein